MRKSDNCIYQKINICLFINGVIIHKVTSGVTCHLYKWSRWNLPIKNKMGTRNLFSRRGLHLRLHAIELLASLTQFTESFCFLASYIDET
jgi:hypothetical protein